MIRHACFTTKKSLYITRLTILKEQIESITRDIDLSMRAEKTLLDEDFNAAEADSILRTLKTLPKTMQVVLNLTEGYHAKT